MSPEQQANARHIDQAKENLGDARDALKSGVDEALEAGAAAASEARAEINEQLEGLMEQGRGMLNQAEDLIRSKPLASFGVAFAAGYLVAALTRRK
ncbi:MAG: hypothetical protein ABIJ73_02120 [Pseudomonadota bacterium]|jgi:ElaB/YqjD/DUF883 family membrane-anchored ribosome-binding protein|uniref:hypothetical protein n=1 Tax=uncultured Arenimonas sp. TaxID=546226 RepID=UPI0030D7C199